MYKLALGALVSWLLLMAPAGAAKSEERAQAAPAKKYVAKKSVTKKFVARHARVKRQELSDVVGAERVRTVRHVSVVRGKRTVTYRPVRRAHPLAVVVARSAGDVAGLNLTDNPLALASNVALVLDQGNSEVLFEKNANVALPIASILGGLVDFALAFSVMLGMMFYYRVMPTVNVLFLPLFLLLAVVTATGVSLWVAALNVKFRDVKYVMPFIVQFWMFASPVVYSSKLLHEPWQRTLYGLNPMVGVLEGFRWALLGTDTKPGPMLAASTVAAILILIGGLIYFRRMENTFADIV